MPLEVLSGSLRVAKNTLPSHLQKVDLAHLQLGRDYANQYIQGSFVTSYQLIKLANGTPFFKIVLQESENSSSRNSSIYILIFGKLAEDCAKVVQQGDIIMVAGFSLTKSTNDPDRHGCQVEVSEEAGSTIYVCTRSSRNVTGAGTTSLQVAPKYTYTPLNQLKNGTVVNLYGAVNFFKPPYLSKGTDYCSMVTILDQSNAKLVCSFFKAFRDALPQIYRIGDIVRFHRIKLWKESIPRTILTDLLQTRCLLLAQLTPIASADQNTEQNCSRLNKEIRKINKDTEIKEFNRQMQGTSGPGFSSLTFDGNIGAPVIPRTSSQTFTFTDEDRKTVEDMRIWVAKNLLSLPPMKKLSEIYPPMFFEFTGKLIGKAKVDGSSYLLKVWDGTKCPFPSWNVFVNKEDLEGDEYVLRQLQYVTVNVVAYDNHVHVAKLLKIGQFISMYNVHAKMHNSENGHDVVQFFLHGGTEHGRGIVVLPENHPDIKELKLYLDTIELALCDDSERASPEPENSDTFLGSCVERCQQLSVTVLTDHQHLDATTLNTIRMSNIPQNYRIRARLLKFEPEKLYQSVKLHCPQCNALREIPDETELDSILREASVTCSDSNLQSPSFCNSIVWQDKNQEQRWVAVHFVAHNELLQDPEDTLVFLEDLEIMDNPLLPNGPLKLEFSVFEILSYTGGTWNEILTFTSKFKGIIPVTAKEDSLALLDLSVPYFWEDNIQYYGCKHCSKPKSMESLACLASQENPSWEHTSIAQELGIVPLEYVFVMKFTLDDGTGTLDVYLRDSETFFRIPASKVLFNNVLQEDMEIIMRRLCPPGRTPDDFPWLECFIRSYYVRDGTENRLFYQIFDTRVAKVI